jgi:hypothetical protein
MKKFIKAKVQFEGIHKWDNCDLLEVDFLKYPHRHIFTIIAKKEISHLDRDVEFIKLGREILSYINLEYKPVSDKNSALNLESTSCEALALKVTERFNLSECEVWEDEENCGGVEK